MTIKSCIKPISGPSIRWTDFLKDTKDLTGHSITSSIDSSGLRLSDYAKYIVSLNELHSGKSNPIDVLKGNDNLLHHLHFSFLVISTSTVILEINELTKLDILSTKIKGGRVAQVSGTLREWKATTIAVSAVPKLRWLSSALLGFFKQMGLEYIFADYKRIPSNDGYFLLEHKSR